MTTEELTRDLSAVEADRAAQINAEHTACEAAQIKTLEHAYRAGELLKEAKDALPHGEWIPWLKEHFPFTERTAQKYMRVTSELSNANATSHLTIDSALKQIAAPKTDEEKFLAECAALGTQIERAARAQKKLEGLIRERTPDDATLAKIAARVPRSEAQLKHIRDKQEAA